MKDEQKLVEEMSSILQEKMQKDYVKGKIKRDAHPKDLGLLKAIFKIEQDLPPQASIGIFSTPKEYNCLIRLSSASGKPQSDKIKDFRGFAIKLLNIKGLRFSNDEKQTQDFVLMSHPTMPLGTVKLFHDAVYYSIKTHPLVLVIRFLLAGNKNVLSQLKNGKKNQTSSLDTQFWSTTPYQLQDTFVKYSIVPTSGYKSTFPTELTDEYLSENNALHLKNNEATFDFRIQFFKNDKQTPLENAGIEWTEDISPFIKVATIVIPKQDILTKQRKDYAEKLSFSPANCLAVHQPVGGINRARIHVYKQLSAFRHTMNDIPLLEPDLETFKELI